MSPFSLGPGQHLTAARAAAPPQAPRQASESCAISAVAGSIWLLAVVCSPTVGWAQPATDLRRPLDATILAAQALEAPLLAPKAYDEAKRLYEAADEALRKRSSYADIGAEVERAIAAAQRAGRAAVDVRALFGETLSERAALLQIDPAIPAASQSADRLLREAAALAEAGDRQGANRIIEQMSVELAQAGAAVLREKKLATTRRLLEQARGDAPGDAIAAAFRELDAAATALAGRRLRVADVIAVDKRLDDIVIALFPAFYRNPPMTLTIDGFTLFVESYERRSWDFRNFAIVRASGFAWLSFHCGPKLVHPFPLASTITKAFRVVETVRDAASEISVEFCAAARARSYGRRDRRPSHPEGRHDQSLRSHRRSKSWSHSSSSPKATFGSASRISPSFRAPYREPASSSTARLSIRRLPPPRARVCGSRASCSSSNIWS